MKRFAYAAMVALALAFGWVLLTSQPAAASIPPPGRCGPGGILCDPGVCERYPWLCGTPTPAPAPAPACNEDVTKPTIYGFTYEPNYPVVVGQDLKRRGFIFRVKAKAGHDECGDPFDLTGIKVEISLSADSVNWILTDLAKRYPGARPLGYAIQDRKVTINGSEGNVRMHVLPYDPGVYLIQITARQSNGMKKKRTFRVPVYLLEGTLIEP